LGRNYEEILEPWRVITKEKGAAIVVLDMPLPEFFELSSQRKRREISVKEAANLLKVSPNTLLKWERQQG